MSGSLHTWYSLPDLDRLAESGAVLSGEIEIKRFERLSGILHTDSGSVRASLRFRQRRDGWLIVEMECKATLQLVCQRCLDPLVHPLHARVEMGLLETESMDTRLPDGCEPITLEDGRLLPAQLIEDELIVSMPLVPRHVLPEECGRHVRDLESQNNGPPGNVPDDVPPTSH
jgi:uncharacterized protein